MTSDRYREATDALMDQFKLVAAYLVQARLSHTVSVTERSWVMCADGKAYSSASKAVQFTAYRRNSYSKNCASTSNLSMMLLKDSEKRSRLRYDCLVQY